MSNSDKELSLYDGRFTVTYTDKGHKYKVNGMPVKGVTTIMSNVLAKNGLMLWPLNKAIEWIENNCEYEEVGEDLPGQRSYEVLTEDLELAKKAHIVARDAGAGTGTVVHELVEKILLGEQVELLDYPEEVIRAVEGFEHWLSDTTPDVLEVERVVYSDEGNYIGTLDSILNINGKNYLCDLKTTNSSKDAPKGVYAENFIQLGGYAKAYIEEMGDESNNLDDLMIISCKKNGKVDTIKASDLGLTIGDCIELWDAVHKLHTGLDKLKDRLKVA